MVVAITITEDEIVECFRSAFDIIAHGTSSDPAEKRDQRLGVHVVANEIARKFHELNEGNFSVDEFKNAMH